ncbi:MAG: D-alanine--D-alanine ligase [Cyclobacteriaceae bacterium]|nr:D-alanine--D-alanine ligase [Cyclobacteriaceae bacterium]
MEKTIVGILFGGRSVEHDVSIISAQNIAKYIDTDKFKAVLIGIDKAGNWFLCNAVTKNISQGKPLQISLSASKPTFSTSNLKFDLDVVFPVLHGTDGEDGSIQGLLKTLRIPHVGSDTLGSAVSMDKLTAKRVLENSGVPVARFLTYTKLEESSVNYNHIVSTLGSPFIIKPANLGSSVGVFKISEPKGFKEKLNTLFSFDSVALVEEFIEGRELECAIIGNETPMASPPGEIIIKGAYDFYSFEAKYVDENAVDLIIPAKVDAQTEEKIKELSIQSYKVASCKDLARIDLFVKEDGQIIVNEINTIPGFTNISMYPKLIGLLGIAYTDLITQLLEMALKRHKQSETVTTNFESNL